MTDECGGSHISMAAYGWATKLCRDRTGRALFTNLGGWPKLALTSTSKLKTKNVVSRRQVATGAYTPHCRVGGNAECSDDLAAVALAGLGRSWVA